MAKTYSKGKNKWALFLLILAGLVLGSFAGYLTREVKFLEWLDYGFEFAIGENDGTNIVTLNLGAIVVHFGLMIKLTVGSVIGTAAAIFVYKKL